MNCGFILPGSLLVKGERHKGKKVQSKERFRNICELKGEKNVFFLVCECGKKSNKRLKDKRLWKKWEKTLLQTQVISST